MSNPSFTFGRVLCLLPVAVDRKIHFLKSQLKSFVENTIFVYLDFLKFLFCSRKVILRKWEEIK